MNLNHFPHSNVENFIRELSTCDNPGDELEAWGVCDKYSNAVPLLVEMSVQWIKNPTVVSAAAGANFYQLMKAAAMCKFVYEEKEALAF